MNVYLVSILEEKIDSRTITVGQFLAHSIDKAAEIAEKETGVPLSTMGRNELNVNGRWTVIGEWENSTDPFSDNPTRFLARIEEKILL